MELERIFKFRLPNNEGIIGYMQNLSKMGKIDAPKEHAVMGLILDRIGRLEDWQLLMQEMPKVDAPVVIEEKGILDTPKDVLNTPKDEAQFQCAVCDKSFVKKIALIGHTQSHKKML